MGQWKVIVVDDHLLMVEAVRAALADAEDFEIVAEAHSGEAALVAARREEPDIAVVDLRMPGMSGVDCIAALKKKHPRMKIVVLSGADDPATIRQALAAGASAYISKLVDPRDIGSALRQVAERTVVSPAPPPSTATPVRDLTGRELEVLRHAASGAPNKEIGRLLCLSEQTVKYHLSHAYAKLGVQRRVDAVRLALEEKLVDPGPGRTH